MDYLWGIAADRQEKWPSKLRKFPIIFPVTGTLWAETGSLQTAPTATTFPTEFKETTIWLFLLAPICYKSRCGKIKLTVGYLDQL
jgi:hypothetical protein